MPSGYEEFIENYQINFPERYGKTKINVMVLGPNIKKQTPSAKLRKFILDQCRGHRTAIKGEHKRLIRAFRRTAGSNISLCSMELDIARNEVDAVIIIPDSDGSFVELGLFSLVDEVCHKTLLLFDKKHIAEEGNVDKLSFIHLGPKRAYESRRAVVDYVDYSDKESAWLKVDNFLQDFRASKYDKLQLGP